MQTPDPFGWVGAILDDQFEVESVAGEGSFGVVYRATHLALDVPVAIKCLKVPFGLPEDERPAVLATFRGEARLLHQLSRRSSGIVQALAVGAATSPSHVWTPYIVMEWLEGVTLERDLKRRLEGSLPQRTPDEALDLLATAASALAVAHEEGVSHRDVKPSNLFLVAARRGSILKLVDFGIAKVIGETAIAVRTDGDRNFTARYAAPEQFMSEYGPTGPWTDVYALALIALEMVTGQAALKGDTLVQIFASSIDQRQRPTFGKRAQVSPEIEAVFSRALAVSPKERFRDVGEMWRAVEAAREVRGGEYEVAGPSVVSTGTLTLPRESNTAPPGERRICTVALIDLSAAAKLYSRLDPEQVQEIVDRTLGVVAEHIAVMEGTCQPLGGDRVMAVFGWPRALDNDPERAILTALRIQDAMGKIPIPRTVRGVSAIPPAFGGRAALGTSTTGGRGGQIAARIGIASGRVFTGTGTLGGGPMLLGEAVHSATELQQLAPMGSIVIGRATYRRVEGAFQVERLSLSSGSSTSEAYRVLGVAPYRKDFVPTDFHGAPTKLVGRNAEIQSLLEALESTRSEKRSRLVTVVAGPGVGRSRLLTEFSNNLKEQNAGSWVISAQASSLAQDTSYAFLVSVLRRRFDVVGDEPRLLQKLRAGMRLYRLRGLASANSGRASFDKDVEEDALQQIAGLIASETDLTRLGRSMLQNENSLNAKHRLSAAVAHILDVFAASSPVVLLCDDIHWADDASLDLLSYLVQRAAFQGLFVVATARPELFDRISLAPLSRRYIEEMDKERLGRLPELPPDLLRLLLDRADGNPLILTETLHLLVDAEVIEPSETGTWTIHENRLGELSLPPTIQGVIQARLDRLPPEAHEALARAAVIGKTFWESALERLRNTAPATTSDVSTPEILSQLRARRLLLQREVSGLPTEREYVFAESALQEVAYEKLPLKTRRILHLAAAEWLAARAQGSRTSAQLAFHYDRGGDPGRAAIAYARAASYAVGLGGHEEALRHLSWARDLHDASSGEELQGMASERRVASWRERVRVRIELGDVLRRAGRLDEAEPVYEEARSVILREERRGGSPYQPSEALRWDARLDYRRGLLLKIRGALEPAIQITEQAIFQATKGGAMEEVPAMCALLAFLQRRSRRPQASREVARKGLRVCRTLSRRGERWREDIAQLLFGLAVSRYAERRFVSAERLYKQAFRTISEAEAPHLAGVALNGIAVSRIEQGDLRGTREMLLRSLRAKERAGDLHQIAIAYSNLADVDLRLQHSRSALENARSAVRIGEQSSAGSDLADMYRNLAEACLSTGDREGALVAGLAALNIGNATGRVYLAEIIDSCVKIVGRVHSAEVAEHPLRGRAEQAAQTLWRVIAAHALDSDMVPRVEAWFRTLSGVLGHLPT